MQLSAPPTAKHRAAWASSQHLPGSRGFLTTPCPSSPYGSFENPATNTMPQLVRGSRFPPAFLPLPSKPGWEALSFGLCPLRAPEHHGTHHEAACPCPSPSPAPRHGGPAAETTAPIKLPGFVPTYTCPQKPSMGFCKQEVSGQRPDELLADGELRSPLAEAPKPQLPSSPQGKARHKVLTQGC